MPTTQSRPTVKPISIKLDADLKARLDAVAALRDRTPHWMMQQAIATYVEREEREARLNAEAVAAYEDYLETGLHLSYERADAWLTQLAAGNDVEIPEWEI